MIQQANQHNSPYTRALLIPQPLQRISNALCIPKNPAGTKGKTAHGAQRVHALWIGPVNPASRERQTDDPGAYT